MFFRLVRRDHVTHYGPFLLPLAVPIGVILAAFGGEGIVPRVDGDYIGPILLIWLVVTFMMGFAQVGLRSDLLKMSLPLPARTVWLARLTSIVVLFVAMAAVAIVIMVAANDRARETVVHRDALGFLSSLLGVLLLGVALIQSLWPTLHEIRLNRRSIAYLVVVWLVCLLLLFALVSLGPLWTFAPLALAAILFVRVWKRLPVAFAMARREPEPAAAGTRGLYAGPDVDTGATAYVASPSEASQARWRRIVRKTIVESLYRPIPVAAIVGVVLVFLGFYISGFYPEPLSGPIYMVWVLGLSPAFIIWPAKNVFRLDHLPLSRRRVFPYLALPAIGMILLGFMGGTIVCNKFTPRPPMREYLGSRDCPFSTRVPDRFLKIAWDGEPPAITAPWGETHQPWTCRPIKGRAALLYSPYSLPAGGSREFVAWQASREMADVYGVDVAHEDIVAQFDRYFERRDGGSWTVKSWGDPLRADYPDLRLRDWARPMAASVLILCVAWFLVTAWIIYAYHSGVSPTFFSLLGRFLPPAIPIFFVAIMVWLGENGYTTSWKLTAMAGAIIRRVADLLPSNPVLLWGVVVVILALSYLLAETAFRRAQSVAGGKIE
jgi:hypothetical protein